MEQEQFNKQSDWIWPACLFTLKLVLYTRALALDLGQKKNDWNKHNKEKEKLECNGVCFLLPPPEKIQASSQKKGL